MGLLHRLAGKFLDSSSRENTTASIIFWWEKRRIAYNIVLFVTGSLGLALFLLFAGLEEKRTGRMVDWEPLSVIIFAVIANMAYTLGWIVESLGRWLLRVESLKLGSRLLFLGTLFAVFLSLLPGLIWMVIYTIHLVT